MYRYICKLEIILIKKSFFRLGKKRSNTVCCISNPILTFSFWREPYVGSLSGPIRDGKTPRDVFLFVRAGSPNHSLTETTLVLYNFINNLILTPNYKTLTICSLNKWPVPNVCTARSNVKDWMWMRMWAVSMPTFCLFLGDITAIRLTPQNYDKMVFSKRWQNTISGSGVNTFFGHINCPHQTNTKKQCTNKSPTSSIKLIAQLCINMLGCVLHLTVTEMFSICLIVKLIYTRVLWKVSDLTKIQDIFSETFFKFSTWFSCNSTHLSQRCSHLCNPSK